MYYYEQSRELEREGFSLHVSQDHLRGERSRWRVRRPAAERGQHMLRFEAGEDQPFLWARVDTYLEDFMVLKRVDQRVDPSVFAPLRQSHVEQIEREVAQQRRDSWTPEDVSRCRALCWARRFARWLGGDEHALRHNMLWGGFWRLDRSTAYARRFSTWRADAFEEYMDCFRALAYQVSHMDLVFPWPVRVSSEEDAARVKYYRKLLRQGVLPPIFCLWVSPFDAPIILDGHDRMLATLLERREPEILILEPFSTRRLSEEQLRAQWQGVEAQYEAIEPHIEHFSERSMRHFNEQVLQATTPGYRRSIVRVWPMRGGTETWRAEVSSQLHHLPDEEHGVGELVLNGFH